MKESIKVVVASANPVKLEAVRAGFAAMGFSGVEIIGKEVSSGVSAQPLTDAETLEGARNRALLARNAFPEALFWAGIEGGIQPQSGGLEAFAWIVILSAEKWGESRTATFRLPEQVAKLIDEGYELGAANDLVFGGQNTKQKTGAVGLLTKDIVTRSQLYTQAVQLALIPFGNPGLYK